MSAAWNARANRSTRARVSGRLREWCYISRSRGRYPRSVARVRLSALLTDSSVASSICATSFEWKPSRTGRIWTGPLAGRQQLQRGDERERDYLRCLIVRADPRVRSATIEHCIWTWYQAVAVEPPPQHLTWMARRPTSVNSLIGSSPTGLRQGSAARSQAVPA